VATLDTLLAQLDVQVANAQGALAALARARGHAQPGDHALSASVWRQGAAGKPAKALSFPIDAHAHTAHQRLAEQVCLQTVRDTSRALQNALLALSALLGAGPDLRRIQCWPALHILVGLDGAQGRVALTHQAPPPVVFGSTWSWGHGGFHQACRLLLQTQARMGLGPEWTTSNSAGGRPSNPLQALDAEAALVYHALCGRPEVLDHASTSSFILARHEPNLTALVEGLRGPAATTQTPPLPAF
jgi:hypothetical protein